MPMSPDHKPEIDATKELDARRASYYRSLIGILRWAVELGRLDILMPVAMMSRGKPKRGPLGTCLADLCLS